MDFKASSNKANEVEMLYSSFFSFCGKKISTTRGMDLCTVSRCGY